MVSLKEACEILVRHYGHKDGLWDISFEFNVAIGAFGPTPDKVLPGAMFGISRIGLAKVEKVGPFTVDAATVRAETRGREA